MDDLVKRADEALEGVTPGPWTNWASGGAIGVDCERSDIAHCSGFDTLRSRKTERANARFIAAARELVPAMRDRIKADAKRIAEANADWGRELYRAEAAEARVKELEARLAKTVEALEAIYEITVEPELKPCPFCGEADQETLMVEHLPGTTLHPAYRVRCDNCGASTGYTDRGDHIAAWNTRATLKGEKKDG